MARRKGRRSTVYMVSVGAHLALGLAIALIPKDRLRQIVGISLADTKKEAPKPAPPPKHEDTPRSRPVRSNAGQRAAAAEPVAATQAEATPTAFTDIGIALDSSSADGLAIAMAPKPVEHTALAPVEASKPKLLSARMAENACAEALVKALPQGRVIHTQYTPQALAAHVEGRVRLELEIDENGDVRSARVIKGLGYGLDEQALDAAKRMHFRPATKCGKPVTSTFTLAVRFNYNG